MYKCWSYLSSRDAVFCRYEGNGVQWHSGTKEDSARFHLFPATPMFTSGKRLNSIFPNESTRSDVSSYRENREGLEMSSFANLQYKFTLPWLRTGSGSSISSIQFRRVPQRDNIWCLIINLKTI